MRLLFDMLFCSFLVDEIKEGLHTSHNIGTGKSSCRINLKSDLCLHVVRTSCGVSGIAKEEGILFGTNNRWIGPSFSNAFLNPVPVLVGQVQALGSNRQVLASLHTFSTIDLFGRRYYPIP